MWPDRVSNPGPLALKSDARTGCMITRFLASFSWVILNDDTPGIFMFYLILALFLNTFFKIEAESL